MTISWNNKFYRVHAVTTDKYGIDPFMDKVVPRLYEIESYTVHEVTQDERGAPDLISLREYGKDVYWWHILTYNGICRFRDIVEGMSLRIPDIGAIISITNQVTVENSKQAGTKIVTI